MTSVGGRIYNLHVDAPVVLARYVRYGYQVVIHNYQVRTYDRRTQL